MMKLLRTFLWTLAILATFRAFVADIFVIPTGSMMPTLKPRDMVVVNKAAFGFRLFGQFARGYSAPKRGDIVAFFMPAEAGNQPDSKTKFVKRCTGVPHNFVRHSGSLWQLTDAREGTFEIPAAHDTLRLTPENIGFYKPLIEQYEHQKAGVLGRVVYINGKPDSLFVFEQDYYFVEGDNADQSHDSRYWGLLPASHLLGRLVGVVGNVP